MFLSTYHSVSVLGLLSQRTLAQTVESYWVVPDGTDPDFTQTFTNGNTIALAWEGWNSTYITSFVHETGTIADLWATSYDLVQGQYSQLLTEDVNIAEPGSYIWNLNVSATSLSFSAKYILRFSAPGKNFDDIFTGTPNIPSPGFIVLPGTVTSFTSSSTLSTSTSST